LKLRFTEKKQAARIFLSVASDKFLKTASFKVALVEYVLTECIL